MAPVIPLFLPHPDMPSVVWFAEQQEEKENQLTPDVPLPASPRRSKQRLGHPATLLAKRQGVPPAGLHLTLD